MHGGFRFGWKGGKENNDVAEMVESNAAALRCWTTKRSTHDHMQVIWNTTSSGKTRLKKACPTVNFLNL